MYFPSEMQVSGRTLSGSSLSMQCKITDDKCAPGWTFLAHTKKCYKYFESVTAVTWAEARHLCQTVVTDNTGDLVSVPDQITNNFLFNQFLLGDTREVFIGGYRDSKDGPWKWSDGSSWSWTANFVKTHQDKDQSVLRFTDGSVVWTDTKISWPYKRYICQSNAGTSLEIEKTFM